MKSIRVVSVVVGMLFVLESRAAETPQAQVDALRAELKPLREQASMEKDVRAARAALDKAYRVYWDTVRTAMIRLDPTQKKKIDREIALRKQLPAVRPAATASTLALAKKSQKSAD